MNKKFLITTLTGLMVFVSAYSVSAQAADVTVTSQDIPDRKVVFATVESTDVVAARARIGGTIVSLNVKEGDEVKAGQEIALVGDQKLALQVKTLDAQIAGLSAQSAKYGADLKRVQSLIDSGSVSKAELDAAKAAASGSSNDLKARQAQRAVIEQQQTEGKIVAPSNGRVLQVPLTAGTVIMPGETVATIAADSYVLRLQLPERHAGFLKQGDKVVLDGTEMGNKDGQSSSVTGEISLVYPQIENGRVQADVIVPNIENYFVGQRVRVWVSTAKRPAILIPDDMIKTRSGVDYVLLKGKKSTDKPQEIPVQRGQSVEQGEGKSSVEILSGLRDGDVLVHP